MDTPSTPPSHPLDRTVRMLVGMVTTLAVLGGVLAFAGYFDTLVALLGVVLVFTYILLGPVNLMDAGLHRAGRFMGRWPRLQRIGRALPDSTPRIISVLVVYLCFVLVIVFASVRFIPALTEQLGEFGQEATRQLGTVSDAVIDWADANIGQGTIKKLFEEDIRQAEQEGLVRPSAHNSPATEEERHVIQESVLKSTLDHLESSLGSAVPSFIGVVTRTLNSFVYFLAGVLLTFYFLLDGPRLRPAVMALLPASARQTADELLVSFHQVMFSFIKGQVMLGILTGFYMFGVYTLFGVPYAFLLGVWMALAELLPVVGTWIGMTAGYAVILLNMDPWVAVYVGAFSYVFQLIKDNLVAPKVVGDVMGLHPLVIILSLMICAKVAGLIGILLALPLASSLNVLLRFLLKKDLREKAGEASA